MEQTNTEIYRTLLEEYQDNPGFFVEHALGHLTWSKQRQILQSVRDNKKTAVRACHGSSKTYTAAEIAVWFLNNFENSKVITTAPTFSQVAYLLWAEINQIYKTSRIELEGECLVTMIKTEKANHYAIGFSTDKPARAEGWHAPAILFIFDEAKGVPQWLWDSVTGLMTGGFCRWLVISTTDGVEVGENFYRIFEKEDSGWETIHIKAEDSPYITGEKFKCLDIPDIEHPEFFKRREIAPEDIVIQIANQEYIDECAKEWGRDSVLFMTKVDGQIIDQAADTIIKLSQIQKMFKNGENEEFSDIGQKEIGVDVAYGGSDDSVFFARKGLKTLGHKTISAKQMPAKEKLEFLADELEIFIGNDKDFIMKIDDTGVGGGLTSIMERRKYNVVPINFAESASDPDNYPNIISEMWFETSKIIQEISCPEIKRLKTELVNRKYKPLDKKGRRVIESKESYRKRGFPSPDMADAFLLCFYEKRPLRKGKVHSNTRPFTPMADQTAEEREQRVRDSVARGKLPLSMQIEDEKEAREEAEKVVKPEEKKHGPRKGRVHIY